LNGEPNDDPSVQHTMEPEITVPRIHLIPDDVALRRVLVVEGEIADPPHADQLYDAICATVKRGATVVELDLTAVPYLTSIGISALLRARQEALALNCVVKVVAASQLVRRTLEVTELTGLLGLPPDEG
jgi:anti-anti-sigma factor